MAEELHIDHSTKEDAYSTLIPQVKALCKGESNTIANQSNITAALKQAFDFFWVGFYWKDSDQELVLGSFQGPIACTRIAKGKGVCGSSWEQENTIIVKDVEQFPGHIACSAESRSEIVVPIFKEGEVFGVLDIDSDQVNSFDDIDGKYLKELCDWIGANIV